MRLDDLLKKLPEATSPAEREVIGRAYRVAETAHAGQKRLSGEDYIQHCLAVAQILADLGAPPVVVAAALLHDTVEDTSVTLEAIQRDFGDDVASLVDGVTKLTELPRVSRGAGRTKMESQRSDLAKETLRKTFLAMGDDVRIVVIKLADRLHNMRTLSFLPAEKRARHRPGNPRDLRPARQSTGDLADEVGAGRPGISLRPPGEVQGDRRSGGGRRIDRQQEMEAIIGRLREGLAAAAIEAEILGRPKHLYSIYRKMERKAVAFDQVYDVRGVRVLVESESDCYLALGVISRTVETDPGRVRRLHRHAQGQLLPFAAHGGRGRRRRDGRGARFVPDR